MSLRTCKTHGPFMADTSTDFGETWCPECGPAGKPADLSVLLDQLKTTATAAAEKKTWGLVIADPLVVAALADVAAAADVLRTEWRFGDYAEAELADRAYMAASARLRSVLAGEGEAA